MTDVPIAQQISCIERELAFRRRCYPGWIQSGKITQATADQELARMEAVLATLQRAAIACELPLEMGGPAR